MKITFLFLTFYILILAKFTLAQDFLEVKYSINDINRQRDNFKNEKIKSVTVRDSYSEKVFDIDNEGKIISENGRGENPYSIIYNYDMNNNLTNFTGPFAHEFYDYDNKGNVIKESVELYTHDYVYDTDNRLIKMNSESEEGETCPFNKIIYNGNLMIEKIYPCCEGNYALRTVYEYSDSGQLLKILHYMKNCSTGSQELTSEEEYFYNDISILPYKMIKGTEEINFKYENYE